MSAHDLPETGAPEKKSRILIVDDDPSVLMTAAVLLEGEGFQTETAPTGARAIERIKSEPFDLVLSDLSMSECDGLEVLNAVRQHQPDAIAILFTGYASVESAIEAMRRGAYDYLIKPVKYEEMIRAIRRGLEKRRLTLELDRLSRLMNAGVDAVLRSTRDLDEALERIAVIVVRLLAPEAGGALFLLDEGNGARPTRTHARTGEARKLLEEDPAARALAAEAAATLQPAQSCNESRALLAVPVEWKGSRRGSLIVCDPSPRTWTDEQVSTAVTIAGRAALSIENSRLYAEVNEEREKLRLILNAAGDGIVGLDPSRRIVFFSRAAERLTGLTEAAVRGRPLEDLLAKDGPSASLDALFDRAAKASSELTAGELVIHSPRSGDIFCDALCCDIRSSRAGQVRTVMALRDARERRRQEEQKTDALSQFTHELKAPLTSIMARVEVMLAQGDGQVDSLLVMRRNVRHLGTLIDTMLATSRISRGMGACHPMAIHLSHMVARAKESFEPVAADRGIEFVVEQVGDPEIQADEAMLAMAVNNLLMNAFKFTDKGGRVSLSVRDQGETVTIEVTDTGIGIPEEFHESIFNRYFQADPSRGGSGLGLAIVRSIAEAHGGRVRVDSRPGAGSRFIIDLPREMPGQAANQAPARATVARHV